MLTHYVHASNQKNKVFILSDWFNIIKTISILNIKKKKKIVINIDFIKQCRLRSKVLYYVVFVSRYYKHLQNIRIKIFRVSLKVSLLL